MRYALFLLLFLAHSAFGEADSAKQLEQVEAELKSLSDAQNKDKRTRSDLYRQLKKQSQTVSKLNRELRSLNQQLKQTNKKLSQLEKEQQQFKRSHAKQLTALNAQLRAAYLTAQPHYLKVLLSQQDPGKLSRSAAYFHYFHQARTAQLADISDHLVTLDSNKVTLVETRQQQQSLLTKQQAKQQHLEQQNQQRLATAKQLEKKINQRVARVASLQEEAQALKSLLDSLAKQHTVTPDLSKPFAKRKGRLAWPVKGKVIARYGSSRQLGSLKWQGIMIKTTTGREVVSAAPGRVVFSDWMRGFGLLLIIDHGDKYMTLYGNNQSLLKEVGDAVDGGELIALSGDQGIKQYAGLYFELRHKGNPTDPAKWLDKRS